jgi:hypothetical protein
MCKGCDGVDCIAVSHDAHNLPGAFRLPVARAWEPQEAARIDGFGATAARVCDAPVEVFDCPNISAVIESPPVLKPSGARLDRLSWCGKDWAERLVVPLAEHPPRTENVRLPSARFAYRFIAKVRDPYIAVMISRMLGDVAPCPTRPIIALKRHKAMKEVITTLERKNDIANSFVAEDLLKGCYRGLEIHRTGIR